MCKRTFRIELISNSTLFFYWKYLLKIEICLCLFNTNGIAKFCCRWITGKILAMIMQHSSMKRKKLLLLVRTLGWFNVRKTQGFHWIGFEFLLVFDFVSFYHWNTYNFEITPVLVSQLEVYNKVDRLPTGLTVRWDSNKTPLVFVLFSLFGFAPHLILH